MMTFEKGTTVNSSSGSNFYRVWNGIGDKQITVQIIQHEKDARYAVYKSFWHQDAEFDTLEQAKAYCVLMYS